MTTIAIIGGTGLSEYGTDGHYLANTETPYGATSAKIQITTFADQQVAFLARHGNPHTVPPHKVNYRANMWALKQLGIKQILAVNAVGGIHPDMVAGSIVIPNQLIDYTYGREHTYSDGSGHSLEHIDFTEPYSQTLQNSILSAAKSIQQTVFGHGVYAVTQGPRLETAAEINKLEREGCDVVGMTAMPEAALARELDMKYASICIVVNPAAGRSDEPITLNDIHRVLDQGIERVKALLSATVTTLG